MRWQLQEAKAKFSELIRNCEKGPQIVSKSGIDQAVVLSFEDYLKLIGKKLHFVDYMKKSPMKGISLNLERDRSPARDSEL